MTQYILNVHVLGKPYNQRESVGHEKGPASKVLLQIIMSIRAPFEAPSVQPRHGVISSKDSNNLCHHNSFETKQSDHIASKKICIYAGLNNRVTSLMDKERYN
ncbi:hypothetical protein YC2023_049021 [Brassica napus]